MGKIYGNTIGGVAPVNVFELELEDGTVLNGVVTEEPPVITATPNDIRLGKTVILSDGLVEGTKDIPAYRTRMGAKVILPQKNFSVQLSNHDLYDYTKIQCIVVKHSSDYSESADSLFITIDDNVYSIETHNKVSSITKDIDNKSIDLNIMNDGEDVCALRYFTCREEE